MNKFTKISATALFAVFLTACDKPAQKTAEVQAPATQEVETTAVTPTTPAAETAAPQVVTNVDEAALADFKKIVDWNATQEKSLSSFQAELQQKLASQDPKQIEEGLNEFTKKVNDVIASLDSVEVANSEVKSFKDKTKATLVLSSNVISESVKAISSPNDESIKASLKAKTDELIQSSTELQKLQAELQQKFLAK